MKQYDVAIVGAGVIGASIARVLSRHALKIALIDARGDVSMGASRANSAIVHAGYDCEPGTNMARLNVRGNALSTGKQASERLLFFRRKGNHQGTRAHKRHIEFLAPL